MRLRNKSTYCNLIRAFDEYLARNTDINISFREKDRLLSYVLFNLSPEEIRKKLDRNEDVQVDWKNTSESVHSRYQNTLWPRLTEVFTGFDLNEKQLVNLIVSTIKPSLLDLEPSLVSMTFQNAIGMQFILQTSEQDNKAQTGHYLLKWYLPSNETLQVPSSWSGVNCSWSYTPSSAQERHSAFDIHTYQIMASVCNDILVEAYKLAPKLKELPAQIYPELRQLRDCHLILIFVREEYQFTRVITDSIVEHYQNASHGKCESPCIEQNSDWLRALQAINFSVYSLWHVFEDQYSDFAHRYHVPHNNQYIDKLCLLVMQYLVEVGLISQHSNEPYSDDMSLHYAVNDAYENAVSDLSKELKRSILLFTHGRPSEFLLDLIPNYVKRH
ncbi:hypothetical protein OH456_05065 [Vibrio sp. La 4.2.2]|uniref:hypothetical protein n=1 Tax=Vibrio sp. La 4.2.2 TaxID=2998830 RepID=UPI0022CDE96A|nr:hypothetical protein [Vibrio sp. La 4.2.2]MDA0107504.1 hypothetical protein [Vibrio sp. La 4.2.2]